MTAGLDEHIEALGANFVDKRAVEFGFEVDDTLSGDKRDRPAVVHHQDLGALLLGVE